MLIDMVLRVSPYIPAIPIGRDSAWANATRNDEVTIKSWDKLWIAQTNANAQTHDFSKSSCMQHYGACAGKPVILMGSGPSLRKNWQALKGSGELPGREDIRIVTNVHNLHFCEDRNLMDPSDYYVVLDAGDVTIRELSDGGQHDPDWYWERTKERTLIAYHATHPEFIRRWKGPIFWFTNPFSSLEVGHEISKVVDLQKVPAFNVGGNVMGAALYFARAVLGCTVPIWMGMDLCFGYDQQFHGWASEYDQKFAGVMPWTDIFGNRVWTWPSYFGFKNWFDYIATGGHGGNAQLWINATEGGIMGSYAEGNIQQIIQLDLKTALHMMNAYKLLPKQLERSGDGNIHLLF